jgi:hypothetical protein
VTVKNAVFCNERSVRRLLVMAKSHMAPDARRQRSILFELQVLFRILNTFKSNFIQETNIYHRKQYTLLKFLLFLDKTNSVALSFRANYTD